MKIESSLPEKSPARSLSCPFRMPLRAPMRFHARWRIGLALTIGLFVFMRRWERRDNQAEFDFASRHYVEAIRRATERIQLTHEFIRQDYYGSPEVSREEFSLCAEPILDRVPSLKVLQWAPRVARAERDDVRADGAAARDGPSIGSSSPTAQGQLVPAQPRDEYFPIWYAASKSGFEARFGWDFAADPVLRQAIDKCRDTGKFVVSDPIDLSKIGIHPRVVQTFLPVYREFQDRAYRRRPPHASPGSAGRAVPGRRPCGPCVELRRRPAGHRPGALRRVVAGRRTPAPLPRVAHARQARRRIGPAAQRCGPAGIHHTAALEFGGRHWSLVCTPAPYFFTGRASWRSWTILAIGLVVTCLSARVCSAGHDAHGAHRAARGPSGRPRSAGRTTNCGRRRS